MKRLVTSVEKMCNHGFDCNFLINAIDEGVSENLLGDLCGNSFVGAAFSSVLWAILLELPASCMPAIEMASTQEYSTTDEDASIDSIMSACGV